jgi:hypothetical protein
MRTCTLWFVVLAIALLGGCREGEEVKPKEGQEKATSPAWPITPEQVENLGKMSREEREAWFEAFGLPRYEAHRRRGTIMLDGRLDEPDWQRAGAVELLTTDRGEKPVLRTTARMFWDDEAIYVAFECDDPDVHAPLTEDDAPLWKHDLVEVFIDSESSGMQYMELHAAPSGATADVIWADFDPATDWFTVKGWEHFKGNTPMQAFTLPDMELGIHIVGTLNNPDDVDEGYTVEWRIPYAGMRKVVPSVEKSRPHPIDMRRFELAPVTPPTAGTTWRMNFNRCDDSTGVTKEVTAKDGTKKTVTVPEYTAWSPPIRSNHMPFRFGVVTFVE